MKPIVKLVFAALIICVSLYLPKKADAQISCQSPGINQCESRAQSGMYQCIGTCIYEASGSNQGQATDTMCWGTKTVVTDPVTQDSTIVYGSSCVSMPSTNASCTQTCINTYEPQFNACIAQYCTNN